MLHIPSPGEFLTFTEWSAIATLAFGGLAAIAFFLKWGVRFRLVGVTGFMLVLTGGLFALSIVPFTRASVPGAVRFTTVFDNGSNQAVILVPTSITESELTATLQKASGDLFSFGRLSGSPQGILLRARTMLHPAPGITEPLYLGEVRRSPQANESVTTIYRENLAKLSS
jgi:hypothetical protein